MMTEAESNCVSLSPDHRARGVEEAAVGTVVVSEQDKLLFLGAVA